MISKKFKTSRQNYQLKEEFHFKNAQEVLHGFLRTAKDKWNVKKALTLCWQICSLYRSHHPDRSLDVWGKWKGSKLSPQTMQNGSKDSSTLRRFYKHPRRCSWLNRNATSLEANSAIHVSGRSWFTRCQATKLGTNLPLAAVGKSCVCHRTQHGRTRRLSRYFGYSTTYIIFNRKYGKETCIYIHVN